MASSLRVIDWNSCFVGENGLRGLFWDRRDIMSSLRVGFDLTFVLVVIAHPGLTSSFPWWGVAWAAARVFFRLDTRFAEIILTGAGL